MMEKNTQNIAERLFEMACSGDIENLSTYFKITGSLHVTCHKLGAEHSLLMGAFRNRQWEMVRWLLGHGAELTSIEQEEINDRFLETTFIWEMQNVVTDNKTIAP